MKVVCVKFISPVDGRPEADSRWVNLHAEYPVLSILAHPEARTLVQILPDDGRTAVWFDSAMFVTSDTTLPPNWVVRIDEEGVIDMGPLRWLVPGFWESYYDFDPIARNVYDEELSVILGREPSIRQVRQLLHDILLQANFSGSDALLAQIPDVHVVGGPVTMLDLRVAGSAPPAALADGPAPVFPLVSDSAGTPVGELLIWAAGGYLSKLEFAWWTDDPPDHLPGIENVEVHP